MRLSSSMWLTAVLAATSCATTYEAKWNEHSAEYLATPLDTGITLPAPLMERVSEVCRAAYRLIGLRDYGRVDVRITPEGDPFILEVNPNPYLNSIALTDGIVAMGRTHPEFLRDIVRNALSRIPPEQADPLAEPVPVAAAVSL